MVSWVLLGNFDVTRAVIIQFILQKLREEESEGHVIVLRRRMLNDRLMLAERGFLDTEGIRGRQWFKHLVSINTYIHTYIVTFN